MCQLGRGEIVIQWLINTGVEGGSIDRVPGRMTNTPLSGHGHCPCARGLHSDDKYKTCHC